VRRGLIAAGGGTQRTVRLLGRTRALNLSLRGLMLDADRAEQIGLITQAVDVGELEAATQALAEELLGLPTLTMAAIKRCINEGGDLDLAGGLAVEQREMSALRRNRGHPRRSARLRREARAAVRRAVTR